MIDHRGGSFRDKYCIKQGTFSRSIFTMGVQLVEINQPRANLDLSLTPRSGTNVLRDLRICRNLQLSDVTSHAT